MEQKVCPIKDQIWDIVPEELKELSNLSTFKTSIKKWVHQNCPFRLREEFIANFGFIWFSNVFNFFV